MALNNPYTYNEPIESILHQTPIDQADRYDKLLWLIMKEQYFHLFRCLASLHLQVRIHCPFFSKGSRNLLSLFDPIGSSFKLPIELLIKQFYKRYGTPMRPSFAEATIANQDE